MSASATIAVKVVAMHVEATDICVYELARADGGPLPAFSAGSHIDVCTPAGVTRQYSLCNSPAENGRYVIAVLKEAQSRGGSVSMHDSVAAGDTLQISAPRNHFPLVHGAGRSLLFAGGIGITPILCMAERLSFTGESFELHYCTRSEDRTAFLDRIRTSAFAAHVNLHFDSNPPDQRLDLLHVLRDAGPDVHLYVCGPAGFIDHVLTNARATGWPEARLHYEFFGAAPADTAGDRDFEVELASSGRVVVVKSDQTVVDALEAAGVHVEISCAQGVCGTCLTRVIAGTPDHRDLYLSPDEQVANDQFLPCCSRSITPRLVLDL